MKSLLVSVGRVMYLCLIVIGVVLAVSGGLQAAVVVLGAAASLTVVVEAWEGGSRPPKRIGPDDRPVPPA